MSICVERQAPNAAGTLGAAPQNRGGVASSSEALNDDQMTTADLCNIALRFVVCSNVLLSYAMKVGGRPSIK